LQAQIPSQTLLVSLWLINYIFYSINSVSSPGQVLDVQGAQKDNFNTVMTYTTTWSSKGYNQQFFIKLIK